MLGCVSSDCAYIRDRDMEKEQDVMDDAAGHFRNGTLSEGAYMAAVARYNASEAQIQAAYEDCIGFR